MENKTEQRFLQVWDYLLDNDELDVSDVLLLSKVISLNETKDGCYISNDGICKLLRLEKKESASRRVNKLKKMGYITLREIPHPNNPKNTRRYIIPTYQNGLFQKSIRVDSKVNTPLTSKSIPIDLKINTPLTQESIPHCLESQSIISPYYIKEEITSEDQLEHISSTISTEFGKEEIIKYICERFEDDLSGMMINLVEGELPLTNKQKTILNENKAMIIAKLPIMENYIK